MDGAVGIGLMPALSVGNAFKRVLKPISMMNDLGLAQKTRMVVLE